MSTSAISPTSATYTPPVGTITKVGDSKGTGKTTLGADDFMKLLSTQMTSQDPMNPMKDTEYISQMASFTSLEQMRTMSNSFTQFSKDQQIASAPQFLGNKVTVADPNRGDVTGTVDSIDFSSGSPCVVINGTPYATSLITSVSTK